MFQLSIDGPIAINRGEKRNAVPIAGWAGAGAIVNNSSICGLVSARAGLAYAASKHAMVGLARNTAHMHWPRGIRCT